MGHYYSEMACSTCGNIRCSCPRKPDMTHVMWLVDRTDMQVMQVGQFDRKYTYVKGGNGMTFPGNPWSLRMGAKLFVTMKEALDHRSTIVDQEIGYRHTKIQELNSQIDTLLLKRQEIINE